MQPAPLAEYLANFPYSTRDEWVRHTDELLACLRRFILSHRPDLQDVDDLSQTCFMYLFERWRKGNLQVTSSVNGLLWNITKKMCSANFNKKSKLVEYVAEKDVRHQDPDFAVPAGELTDPEIQVAFALLSATERNVVEALLAGYKPPAIAAMLDMTIKTVYSRKCSAIRKMREQIGGKRGTVQA